MSCKLKNQSKNLNERSEYDQKMNQYYSSWLNPRTEYDIKLQQMWGTQNASVEKFDTWTPGPRTSFDMNGQAAWCSDCKGCVGISGPPCSPGEGGIGGSGSSGSPSYEGYYDTQASRTSYDSTMNQHWGDGLRENFQAYAMQDPDNKWTYTANWYDARK
jgi:hypothetical protein